MNDTFDALPTYLGSKRSQARKIFRAIVMAGYGPAEGHRLLDPFMGGGSISLMGKTLGYSIAANDSSAASEAIGKALIENDHTKLTTEDVSLALTFDPGKRYMPSLKQLPWPDNSRHMLAGIAACADGYEDDFKRALMRAWMVKTATALSIYGQPRMSVHGRIRDKNWDAMTPGQVQRILEPQTNPRPVAVQAAEQMVKGIRPNGYVNTMHRMDVLEFLALDHRPGVVYLDPPYPDTEGYGRNYVGIESLLENRELEPTEGRFAAPDGWTHLREVLAACERHPVVVLSLGAEVKHVTADELEDMMRESGREVTVETIDYGLLRSRATSKSDGKKEHLICGRL